MLVQLCVFPNRCWNENSSDLEVCISQNILTRSSVELGARISAVVSFPTSILFIWDLVPGLLHVLQEAAVDQSQRHWCLEMENMGYLT